MEIVVSAGDTIAETEKKLILATLKANENNKKKTAETLGISLKTLYNRLSEYRGYDEAIKTVVEQHTPVEYFPTPDPISTQHSGIVGLFVHIFDGETIKWQGKIIALESDIALIQVFEWGSGLPTTIKPFVKSDLYTKQCRLYASAELMTTAYEHWITANRKKWEV